MPVLKIVDNSANGKLENVKAGHIIKFHSDEFYLRTTSGVVSLQTFTPYHLKDFSTQAKFEDLGALKIESQ